MKHIAIGLDFDGCILTRAYIHPFEPQHIRDIKTNTSIIDINSQLWIFIGVLCKNNPDLEKLTLIHFSSRQSAEIDFHNSTKNKTESSFLAMVKITAYLTQRLKVQAPQVSVELNRLLMPDIYRNKKEGDTHKTALEDIDYSAEGKGIISLKAKHNDCMDDESKVTFVFAHAHAIPAEAFYYFDDRIEILQTIEKFYSDPLGASLLPREVKINLHLYFEGRFETYTKETYQKEIVGTGNRYSSYAEILRIFFRKAYYDNHLLPSISAASHEESIHIFHLAMKRLTNTDKGMCNFLIEDYLPIFWKQPSEAVYSQEHPLNSDQTISSLHR